MKEYVIMAMVVHYTRGCDTFTQTYLLGRYKSLIEAKMAKARFIRVKAKSTKIWIKEVQTDG